MVKHGQDAAKRAYRSAMSCSVVCFWGQRKTTFSGLIVFLVDSKVRRVKCEEFEISRMGFIYAVPAYDPTFSDYVMSVLVMLTSTWQRYCYV